MLSKTLSFNRGIFIQDLRSVGWVGIAYFLCLLFALPLQLLMAYTRDGSDHHYFGNTTTSLFSISIEFQVFLMFLLPVLLSIFIFRYMQVKLSSDFIHSLPLNRESLFNQHALLGIVILFIPIFLTGVILLVLATMLPHVEYLSIQSVMSWVGTTLLFNLFVFFAGVFVAMLTGMSVLQGALIYIMFIFPTGISVLTVMNLQFFWFGFAGEYYLTKNIERILPFVRVTELSHTPLTMSEIVVYFVFIIVFYVGALLIYKNRDVESATQAIAFRSLRPVFKYGITICSMLVGGLYFGGTQNGQLGWILFGYIAVSLIGYFIAEMILEKSWRVFDKWKGYVAYTMAIIFVGFVMQFDVLGYEKKVPDFEEVKKVYMADGLYYLMEENRVVERETEKEIRPSYSYQQEENIKNIRLFHEQIVRDQNAIENYSGDTGFVVLGYDLESGETLVRQYRIPVEVYDDFYRPIIESEEHKYNQNPVMLVDDLSELDRVTIHANLGKRVVLTDPKDMLEFHQVLTSDIEKETYADMTDIREPWAQVEYLWANDKRISTQWKKSYVEVERWLEQKGLKDQARVTSEDISHAIVFKNESNSDIYEYIHRYELDRNFELKQDGMRIQDPMQLEEVLQTSGWDNRGKYIIAYFYHQHSYPDFYTFPEGEEPEFIKEYFKN
ncbi:hypothetical protein [Alkalihalobacterium alkalinitrilicum]|uniref:hypothetical protein n=1 Tax=Alkalihalobacterium alkalinitrilicum TaxID=427920 RepID=UPI0009952BC5|nr:hypothetical protein [Alkalihalobacterium alkalinitrilicum]